MSHKVTSKVWFKPNNDHQNIWFHLCDSSWISSSSLVNMQSALVRLVRLYSQWFSKVQFQAQLKLLSGLENCSLKSSDLRRQLYNYNTKEKTVDTNMLIPMWFKYVHVRVYFLPRIFIPSSQSLTVQLFNECNCTAWSSAHLTAKHLDVESEPNSEWNKHLTELRPLPCLNDDCACFRVCGTRIPNHFNGSTWGFWSHLLRRDTLGGSVVWSGGFSLEAPTSSSGSETSLLDLILLLTPEEYNAPQFESFLHKVVVAPVGRT